MLIWIKQTLIWFSLQTDGTINGFSNIKETFAENVLLQMSVLQKRITDEHFSVFNAGLSGSYDGWTKCKEKVPDVSNLNQNIETRSHSKLKFT